MYCTSPGHIGTQVTASRLPQWACCLLCVCACALANSPPLFLSLSLPLSLSFSPSLFFSLALYLSIYIYLRFIYKNWSRYSLVSSYEAQDKRIFKLILLSGFQAIKFTKQANLSKTYSFTFQYPL